MRADRLLSILLLLQTRGRMTAATLAERLEVSGRTIYRDLDALSAAGVPVYAERGAHGGCVLRAGYRTDLTGLNEIETASLFAGVAAKVLEDLGLGQGLQRAFVKLEASLPSERRSVVDRIRARVHVDVGAWFSSADTPVHLGALRTAVFNDRAIRLRYAPIDRTATVRVVAPLGLVVKGGIWYLVASVGKELRVFRADRIRELKPTEKGCVRPVDFDLASFWRQWSAKFVAGIPEYWATFRISPGALPILQQVFGDRVWPAMTAAQRHGSWSMVRLAFDSLEAACGSLLRLGMLVEVLEPPELRSAIARTATEVTRLYAGQTTPVRLPSIQMSAAKPGTRRAGTGRRRRLRHHARR